ncbi:lytic transglycosylase domain-containing protein [Actinocorallia libanotica]|uniref:Transglycosylase-like protein with SLT domain n=1 Tax=Actinocorallia libanotica TaxID=46162 RepID=A0ABP4B9B3_9ACTN
MIGTCPLGISRRLPVAATAVLAATGLWSAPAAAEANVSRPSGGSAVRINPQVHEVHRVPAAQVIQKVQKAQALKKAVRAARKQQKKRSLSRVERNKVVGLELAERFGWDDKRQWRCLERLWTRESGWNHLARNPSSGAHGIPQALPGSKMGGIAADWRTNPETQIKWGLRYIKGRYGTPCAAWAHFGASGWY